VGDTLEGGDTRVKAIKSDKAMSKKRSSVFVKKKSGVTPQNWRLRKARQVFQDKNRGVTPSVAAPCVTHPSDATELRLRCFGVADAVRAKTYQRLVMLQDGVAIISLLTVELVAVVHQR